MDHDFDSTPSEYLILNESLQDEDHQKDHEYLNSDREYTEIKFDRSQYSWMILLIKLSAIASYIGGPLWFTDVLKSMLDDVSAFIISFTPIGLLIFGQLALLDDERSLTCDIGAFAALLLIAINGVALCDLYLGFIGQKYPHSGLMILGSGLGLMTSLVYLHFYSKR